MIWLHRSDLINFSMPYSQIADLTLTLCFEKRVGLLVNSLYCGVILRRCIVCYNVVIAFALRPCARSANPHFTPFFLWTCIGLWPADFTCETRPTSF